MSNPFSPLVAPKHRHNPIIPLVSGSWYESQVYDFNVMVDPADSTKLKMYASGMAAPVQVGTESIGLFTANASEPYIWTNQGQVMTALGTGWEATTGGQGIRVGSIFYDSGMYYLYYNNDFANGQSIGLATSTDGTTFTRYSGNPILTPTGQGRNDGDHVSQPFVIKEGSAWTMIYSYRNGGVILPGFRYATSSDGLTWTKGGSGDILTTSPLFGEYHQVLKIGGHYYLLYEVGSFTVPYRIFVADSDSVTGPYGNVRQFFMESTGSGNFDQYHVATPFVFYNLGDWILYYCGAGEHDQPFGTNHWPGGGTLALREISMSSTKIGIKLRGDRALDDRHLDDRRLDDRRLDDRAFGAKTITPTPPPTHPLKNSLISYWKLDEASGTRVDSFGSNDLTDNNTVGNAAGIINNGALFIKANSEYLSHTSNSFLQMSGNTDWTITAWIKLSSVPIEGVSYSLVTKDDSAANSRDYTLDYAADAGFGTGGFRVYIQGGGTYLAKVGAEAIGSAWYFVVAWYDSSNGQLHLRINDTTTYNSSTGATGTDVSAAQFRIGARQYSGAESYSDAVIDEVGIWKRKLTVSEITQLYNGGNGLPFSSF